MIKIIKDNEERELHINKYTLISELIRESAFSMPCGGKGTCLKCKVKAEGDISPLSELEEKALSVKEKADGIRLACQAKIKSGKIILTDNFMKKTAVNGEILIGKGKKGIAVDIGTTTVAAYYYNGEYIERELSEKNKLASFGADVMSRIGYATENPQSKMHDILSEQIESLIKSLVGGDSDIVITGNTVMLSIYSGEDISKMGLYPYTPKTLFGEYRHIKGREVYIPRCISAFAGADLACAALASGIYNKERALLIDIGTNGEILLKNGERIICTSVSAGPSFEGVGLKCGMSAADGVITKVFAQGTNLKFRTMNGKSPVGICGSGIIDLLAVLKKHKAAYENGIISDSSHPFTHLIYNKGKEKEIYLSGCDISVTQSDIRNIQLAKSAVISGIKTLLYEEKLSYEDIDALYISGSFGNFIDIENAAYIKLIPEELTDKVKLIGNGAGLGALMLAVGTAEEKDVSLYEYKDLSENGYFMSEFIENINL